jgi:ABC-type transporter Mla maintaining outer membrane lipid asymmetry permease subunit MlaE
MTTGARLLRNIRYSSLFGAVFSGWAIVVYLVAGRDAPPAAELARIVAAYMGSAIAAGALTALLHPLQRRAAGRLLTAIVIAAAVGFALALAVGGDKSTGEIAIVTAGYALTMGPIGAWIFRPRR